MKVKELKEILAHASDDAEVVVTDKVDASIHIVNWNVCGNIVYLETNQVFPEDWYDENYLEIGYDYDNDLQDKGRG